MRSFAKIFMCMMLLLVTLMAQEATYDTLSIHDIQYVEIPSNLTGTIPDSIQETGYIGDTIVVKAFVRHGMRELYLGARWGGFVSENSNDPWSGFFVIQDDTTASGTYVGFLEEGDEVYFTGYLTTYYGLTQLNLLTNPVTPVEIVSSDNTLPEPIELTLADLSSNYAGEKYESMLATIKNVKVTNNDASSGQAIITDGTNTGYIDDYFMCFRALTDADIVHWPANGTSINITGYLRDSGYGYFSINPRDTNDIEILAIPPEITGITRSPELPKSTDASTLITATISDNATPLANISAYLHYSIDWQDFVTVQMSQGRTGFTASIPQQADGAFVRYFISAYDHENNLGMMPGDTRRQMFFFHVRDNGYSIYDIQYPMGYSYTGSAYEDYAVTLEGVVMTDSTDFVNNLYIAENDSVWSGIWIYQDDFPMPNKGDWIRVTGTVVENFNHTQLTDITALEVVTPNYGVFDPVVVNIADIKNGGSLAEAYESILVEVDNVTVSNPFPDGNYNYGEFSITQDGVNSTRVGDDFTAYNGQLDSSYALGDHIEKVIGFQAYSYNYYKILPRNANDIIGHTGVGIDDSDGKVANKFALGQNYPNPFNHETNFRFNIPKNGNVTLTIYNLLGVKVKTLYSGKMNAGTYDMRWNGLDNNGNMVSTGVYFYQLQSNNNTITKKMLFLK